MECPRCHENPLAFDGEQVRCSGCNYQGQGKSAANEWVEEVQKLFRYRVVKDRGKWLAYT